MTVEAKFDKEQEDDKRNPVQKAAGDLYCDTEDLLNKMNDVGQKLLHELVEEHGIEMLAELGFNTKIGALNIMGEDMVALALAKYHVLTATIILERIYAGKADEGLKIGNKN